MAEKTLSIDPADKLGRLIQHSRRLIDKQDEVREILREAVARAVEEKLRAQNGGYLRLREYEHMRTFALRKALLGRPGSAHHKASLEQHEQTELFNALVEKMMQEASGNVARSTFRSIYG
jgi:hypothetical protein